MEKISANIQQYRDARLSRDARFDGRFFVAVLSTGIFCRPVCPARAPLEKNVRYYASAVDAMHDGYRPCLRCRPDSAPGSPAWNGVATSFERAQSLLRALPVQKVSDVAERMGITTRYLHKLFDTRLGMSPLQFQKYHQLLFAKQLLQQTALSVERVAEAAGFQSSRRLQALMAEKWGLSPTTLRAKKSSAVAPATLTLFLSYRPPYDWAFVRDFLQKRALNGTEWLTTTSYRRAFMWEGEAGMVEAKHQPSRHGFSVRLTMENVSYARAVLDNVARVLDVNAVPELINCALNAAGAQDGTDDSAGIRLPGVWSAFEAGCRAVLGQQVSVTAAIKNVELLVSALGEPTTYGQTFPNPAKVAADPLDFLRMPGARKDALRHLAGYFAKTHSTEVEEAALMGLKGIGPWTVDYLIMRGLSDPDRYLGGDLVIKKMASRCALSPEKAAPWRSYLTLHLWRQAS